MKSLSLIKFLSIIAFFYALLFFVCFCVPRIANAQVSEPSVTLTATPMSGISPLAVSLTWSGYGVDSCVASGAWSGSKAISGTEVISGVRASSTYTLTCSTSTGRVIVSWEPPTQNTDDSPIAPTGPGSLAGFKIYHAPVQASLPSAIPIVVNDKAATSYTILGLPTGTRFVAVSAFNVEGVESALSVPASKVISAVSVETKVSVSVSVKPKPPVTTLR